MPDISKLLEEAWENESQGSKRWLQLDSVRSAAARAVARRRRTRIAAVASVAAATLFAATAVAVAALRASDADPIAVPTPSISSIEPTQTGSASLSPSPTPAAELDWADVADDDKPNWSTEGADGEPAARQMAPWVWDYVTDEWSLEVYRDLGENYLPLKSQALLLRAPNDDLFRIATLTTASEALIGEWNADEHIAWLQLVSGGDSWQSVQVNVETGSVDADWLPVGLADPYGRGWFEGGVWDVARVAEIGHGRELWANYTYSRSYDGFFIREADGSWTPMIGMDAVKAAVAAGSTNGAMDSGIEAWFDPDARTVAILLQWGTYDSSGRVFHTTDAQWVVATLDDSGVSERDAFQVSDRFVPTPVLCSAYTGEEPRASDQSGAALEVTAGCGSDLWRLYPPSSAAVRTDG